jgi:uncharacterized repeat protein (TIGR04076 family)
MAKVKITVLKRTLNEDLAARYAPPGLTLCPRFLEGQEYIAEGQSPPAGFCGWAWHDIHKCYLTLLFGGGFGQWMKADNNMVACCTDGLRPVIFNLERIDD